MAVQGSLLKNALGYPYIPGSSLKGVLRSFLESVQSGMDDVVQPKDCVCCKNELKGKKEREARGSAEELALYIAQNSCPACKLFGNGVMAGKLKFADAALLDVGAWMGTEIRTSNAIDRDTHTANTGTGALFDTEAIPAGTEFALRVTAENLTEEEARIFGELMQYFAEGGITVGGRSRAGLGMVKVEGISLTLYYLNGKDFAPVSKEIALKELAEEVKPYV